MDLTFLETIRLWEFEAVLTELRRRQPLGAEVLEIGAGSGWQARQLAEHGYRVQAIDLPSSHYAPHRVWPILDYDGRRIPFPDGSFDVVFSSNVLEHLSGLQPFLIETVRVLRPNGLAIHVLPTGMWRFWTTLTHYATLCRIGLSAGQVLLRHGRASLSSEARKRLESVVGNATGRILLRRMIIPTRHGEVGNALTETWVFSRMRWTRVFRRAGWTIEGYRTNQLAYSGHALLGDAIGLSCRQRLSKVMGSACHIFVLRPPRLS
jgi:SAM-dependent methyltransferase